MVNNPSISVNKLGEYIMSRGARQRKILKDRKYPDPDFQIGMYHREASEAVTRYLAAGAIDAAPLDEALRRLEQQPAEKIGTSRRILANIDALERFNDMLDDINFFGGIPELADKAPPKLSYFNVNISVRPEIIVRSNIRGKLYVGALKLHFSKTHPHDKDSAGYVSAALNEFCARHVATQDEKVNPDFCQVIDVASGTVFPGVKSTRQKLKDIEAECQNIAAIWAQI